MISGSVGAATQNRLITHSRRPSQATHKWPICTKGNNGLASFSLKLVALGDQYRVPNQKQIHKKMDYPNYAADCYAAEEGKTGCSTESKKKVATAASGRTDVARHRRGCRMEGP
jgi:hypothetical protein